MDTRRVRTEDIPHYERLAPAVQRAAKVAVALGLRVTSSAEGRPGDGVHTPRSFHYPANNPGGLGHAIDVAGAPEQMALFFDYMAAVDPGARELFYDPRGGIRRGRRIGPIGGHADHVHYAADPERPAHAGLGARPDRLTNSGD